MNKKIIRKMFIEVIIKNMKRMDKKEIEKICVCVLKGMKPKDSKGIVKHLSKLVKE